ncbi:hypothetical protein C8J56DRAFT_1156656 [Mycena floridula]|nr:hypothetical protein C8J56DRAFT_1156656 [Mycena floridula]
MPVLLRPHSERVAEALAEQAHPFSSVSSPDGPDPDEALWSLLGSSVEGLEGTSIEAVILRPHNISAAQQFARDMGLRSHVLKRRYETCLAIGKQAFLYSSMTETRVPKMATTLDIVVAGVVGGFLSLVVVLVIAVLCTMLSSS